jgi:pantothenate synthetase
LAATVISQTEEIIAKAGAKMEYAVVVNDSTLKNETIISPRSVLAIAAKIGGTVRLIDNARLFSEPACCVSPSR